MLVLTQRVGSRVRLTLPDGRFVWVTVTEVDRGKARVGYDAPRDVEILREEIVDDGRQGAD